MSIDAIVQVVCAGLGIEPRHLSAYSQQQYLQARAIAVQLCVDYDKRYYAIRDVVGISLDQIKTSRQKFEQLKSNSDFMRKYYALKNQIERRAA